MHFCVVYGIGSVGICKVKSVGVTVVDALNSSTRGNAFQIDSSMFYLVHHF